MSLNRLFRRRVQVPFAEWGHEVRDFQLPVDGRVQFAQWRHPLDTPKLIDQPEIDGLRRFIQPGDFAIDIGAHTGDTTVPMALAAGRTGLVLALEPNPFVFQVLQQNVALNPLTTNIDARCFAATKEDGAFIFHYTDASFCNGGFKSEQRWKLFRRKHPLSIDGRNLLRVLRSDYSQWLPKLSYVKVDAEGYDRVILESIMPILRESQPVIRTEVFRKLMASERHELFDLLADNGFSPHRYIGGDAMMGPCLQRNDMTAAKHFDVIALPAKRCAKIAA